MPWARSTAHLPLPLLAGLAACFVDPGLETAATADPTTTTTTSADPTTTSSTSTTSSTTSSTSTTTSTSGDPETGEPTTSTTDPPAVCGDGVVQPPEACDDGPANAAHGLAACRPDCQLPACGDGSLYLGPLGAPIEVATVNFAGMLADDTPRPLALLDEGPAGVVWESAGGAGIFLQNILADDTLGAPPLRIDTTASDFYRDAVIAADDLARVVLAWETGTASDRNIRLRRYAFGDVGDTDLSDQLAHPTTFGDQISPSLAFDGDGAVLLAYLSQPGVNQPAHVFVRRIPPGDVASAPSPVKVSLHDVGTATPPILARAPDGAALVAWGDPSGPIVYRRLVAGAPQGPVIDSDLSPGRGGPVLTSLPFTAAALAPGGALRLAGLLEDDTGRHLAVQPFDAADQPSTPVIVTAAPVALIPYLDLAADAAGNLAVAWTECGDPNEELSSCQNIPARTKARWLYADLTLAGPPVDVGATTATPSVAAVRMAADGSTALAYREGARVYLRRALLSCP